MLHSGEFEDIFALFTRPTLHLKGNLSDIVFNFQKIEGLVWDMCFKKKKKFVKIKVAEILFRFFFSKNCGLKSNL